VLDEQEEAPAKKKRASSMVLDEQEEAPAKKKRAPAKPRAKKATAAQLKKEVKMEAKGDTFRHVELSSDDDSDVLFD
jgi:hypothetical protein